MTHRVIRMVCRTTRWGLPALVSVCLVASGACRHYGLAGRSDEEASRANEMRGRPTLAVSTVATPARWHLDGAHVTRHLVRSLRRYGLDARWDEGNSEERRVVCAAALPQVAVYHRLVVPDVRVTCHLYRSGRPTRTIEARASRASQWSRPGGEEVARAPGWVGGRATLEAFETLAPKLAELVRTSASPDSPSDSPSSETSGLESDRE